MDTPIFHLFNKDINGFHLALSGGIVLFLTAIKYYMTGGVCRASKDLTGKLAVITGGNTGIGRETALDLALKNCDLIIGARDKGKLEEVIKEIKKINPNIKATYSILDLGDKESII
jgi:retinol dehydrogenase-12